MRFDTKCLTDRADEFVGNGQVYSNKDCKDNAAALGYRFIRQKFFRLNLPQLPSSVVYIVLFFQLSTQSIMIEYPP